MLVCISIHADTEALCFRPKILKRVNSSELVVQKIVYLAKGIHYITCHFLHFHYFNSFRDMNLKFSDRACL